MYEYEATIVSVYDGDTVRADIDLGFKIWHRNVSIRLAEINTPEIRGEEREAGLISRDRLRKLVLGKEVLIKTNRDKTGKYGRYIASIYLNKDDSISINDQLVEEGLAEYKEY